LDSFIQNHDEEEFQMKTRLLLTTAVGLVFATAAFAQAPRDSTTSPTTQTQSPSTQKTPDTPTGQTPSSNATAPATSSGSSQAQTAPSTSSQSGASSSGGSSAPAQAQTNAPPPSNDQAQHTPATGSSNNQAQQAPNQAQQAPSNQNTTAQQPSQNTTAQQPSQSTTAQQPSQSTNPPSNTAQSSSTNVNASVNINDQQRTRVTQSIARLNVQPLTNVNFSLSVGTSVPRDVRLQTLPADVVEVVPQYRGYSFFVVRDEIVIVEPSTYKIVTVLPRSGGSAAAAPARSQSKVSFTDRDRDAVRKHVKTRTERQAIGSTVQTTGSAARTVIRRGERLPDSVEVEEFPETVYREAPALREYRYIHRENRTYLVDPAERTVISTDGIRIERRPSGRLSHI
jgi:hypothetical protein